MDIQTITALIGTMGFPIAAYILLFWHTTQIQKMNREDNSKFAQSIDNNTNILTKVYEVLQNMTNNYNMEGK